MGRWQHAGRRIEQACALGAAKFAILNTSLQLSIETPIQSAQGGFLQFFLRHGQDQQIGLYRFRGRVSEPYFHAFLT
jgi:hypothetical protein